MNKMLLGGIIILLVVLGFYLAIGWDNYRAKWESQHATNEPKTCTTFSPDFSPIDLKTTIEPYGYGK